MIFFLYHNQFEMISFPFSVSSFNLPTFCVYLIEFHKWNVIAVGKLLYIVLNWIECDSLRLTHHHHDHDHAYAYWPSSLFWIRCFNWWDMVLHSTVGGSPLYDSTTKMVKFKRPPSISLSAMFGAILRDPPISTLQNFPSLHIEIL